MARLHDRIENVLNETRMLLLGGQVLLGFTYRICFEPSFEKLRRSAQLSELIALAIMTAGLSWLLWPATFHQVAEHGWQSERLHSFNTAILDWALLPFCLGIGLGFYPVSVVMRVPHPALISIVTGTVALAAWYGGLVLRDPSRRGRNRSQLREAEKRQREDLPERIKKVLIECRMALPGAQAFLGFQFAIVFTASYDKLPRLSQWVHFGSLLSMILAIVLLIAPAAYHRLAEGGDDTEHFHDVASFLLLAGIVFLAPGMAGDLYVVMQKITGSVVVGAAVATGLLIASYGLWFGVSVLKRRPAE